MMINIDASCFPRRHLPGKLLLLGLVSLLLASCATRLRLPADMEPERLLPAGALAYVRVNPARLGELVLPLIEPYGMAQSKDLLDRTDSMVLAVMPPGESPEVLAPRPVVYGVVSGNFPTRSIALKLDTDKRWAREAPGWIHREEGFRVALSTRGQVLLGTASLGPILQPPHDRPHPVPDFWNAAWNNDLAAFIPEPLSFLAGSLPVDLSGLPLESLLLSVRRIDTRYDVYLGFEFATERTALVFAPLCRLFLFALTRSLWPAQASGILGSVSWVSQGVTVGASGLVLEASQLTSLLALPFDGLRGPSIGPAGASR